MKKVFNIIAALLILTVTAVGSHGYYVCNSDHTIHLLDSCCSESQTEKECCCSEPVEEENVSEICCNKVDLAVDQCILTKSNGQDDKDSELYFAEVIISSVQVKYNFKFSGVPPPGLSDYIKPKIYISICSFLC